MKAVLRALLLPLDYLETPFYDLFTMPNVLNKRADNAHPEQIRWKQRSWLSAVAVTAGLNTSLQFAVKTLKRFYAVFDSRVYTVLNTEIVELSLHMKQSVAKAFTTTIIPGLYIFPLSESDVTGYHNAMVQGYQRFSHPATWSVTE